MQIKELLSLIANIAKNEGLSEPFIVGGLPRDKLLNKVGEVKDIDITTGDESIKQLAQAVNKVLSVNYPDVSMKTFPDGHSQINTDGIKIDFSSNFKSPEVTKLLARAGYKGNPMMEELMSRDFTVNTLLLGMDLQTIKDPTGSGIKDIKNKILKTPLPPEITLSNDPKRIPRIIYMATKLGFDVEPQIIDFVKKNPQLMKGLKEKYIANKINQSLDKDPYKTIELINKMNLWDYIPITEKLRPYWSAK